MIKNISLSKIVPDNNQPRKYFELSKMNSLKASIEKNGIINPIIVETKGEGYLIVDGERRFRAATELGLKEVPVLVTPPMNDSDRLIRQFNIQEQYSQWTLLEKAVALSRLSESLRVTIYEICDMLGMQRHEKENYSAFADLADKEGFIKGEIELRYAKAFRSLKSYAKKAIEFELEGNFLLSDEKRLEKALIRSIKNGSINENKDITKLKDAFKKNPKLIEKFIEENVTPQELFVQAKAKSAYYLRNLTVTCSQVSNIGLRYLEEGDCKVTPEEMQRIVKACDVLKKVVEAIY